MSVDITAKFLRSTDRAICVEYNGESVWLPLSQLEYVPDLGPLLIGVDIDLSLSDWIAGQKGITTQGVDLERFDIVETVNDSTYPAASFVVRDGGGLGDIMCHARTRQKANMIAAALNLTQGKV